MTKSLPLRTLGAAVVLGVAGVAVARAVAILLAGLAVPSFERTLRPARFAYDAGAIVGGSATWAWVIAAGAVILLPLFLNGTWMSARTLSAPGIAKLAAAAVLGGLVAVVALTATDFFVDSPWGGGSSRSMADRLVLVVLAGLCGGALFGLFGQGVSTGAPGVWRDRSGATVSGRRGFAHGFAAAVVASLFAFVAANALGVLFQSLGYLGESAEVSPLGWARAQLGLALGLGLLLATCGAVLAAASPEPAGARQRVVSGAIAAVPAAALVAVAVWFTGYARSAGETDRTLAQAARLEPPGPARLMILPGPSGARVFPYPMVVTPIGWVTDTVGASERNVALTAQYLKSGARWTVHTAGAWQVAPAVHDRLLQPEDALRELVDAAEATGSILSTSVAVARVQRMPLTTAVRDVAGRLLDSTRFRGDRRRAELEADATAPRDRAVIGAVDLPAEARAGARVGLFRQATLDGPSYVPSAAQLVAAVEPDARGRFAVEGLPPGIYAVGVLLPAGFGSDPQRVTVNGVWRVVDVSQDRKRADAGTVKVSMSPR